jgi:hypothetical protein
MGVMFQKVSVIVYFASYDSKYNLFSFIEPIKCTHNINNRIVVLTESSVFQVAIQKLEDQDI